MISLRSLRRRPAAALALTAALAGAGVLATAAPADASGPAGALVCFGYPSGVPYAGPVYAQTLRYGLWTNMGSAASTTGCTSWTVESGNIWRFQAMAVGFGIASSGVSNSMAIWYPGMYNFGSWVVTPSYY
jgi:hypothetical protein